MNGLGEWVYPLIVIIVLLFVYFSSGDTVLIEPYWDIHVGDLKSNHPIIRKLQKNLQKIDNNLLKIPIFSANKSYTFSKKQIYLCCYNENGDTYDDNTLMYALLHEITHILTDFGADGGNPHGNQFKERFNKLLEIASQKGIWNRYLPIAESYKDVCGIKS